MNSVLDLQNLIQGFKLSCQTEGKSPKTIEWYTGFLNRFYDFLERNNLPTDVSQINRNHVREFIRYLQIEARTPHKEKPLSRATVQGYVRTLKAFFSWAIREDYINFNPMVKITVPKAPSKIINTFTYEQIIKLTDLCHTANGSGYRNLTILLLLLDSGIRVSELVSIDLCDINLTEGYIKIRRAKGNKERLVPIGSLVQKSLWKYMNHYRPQPVIQKVTKLFLSNDVMHFDPDGIPDQDIDKLRDFVRLMQSLARVGAI